MNLFLWKKAKRLSLVDAITIKSEPVVATIDLRYEANTKCSKCGQPFHTKGVVHIYPDLDRECLVGRDHLRIFMDYMCNFKCFSCGISIDQYIREKTVKTSK